MEIAEIGRNGLLERIGGDIELVETNGELLLHSAKIMSEGVHFDLAYFPLQHLGYKAVVAGIDGIIAHNGIPRRVMVSLGISARFTVEDIEALMEGVRRACYIYNIVFEAGDITASVNGLIIAVTAFGCVQKGRYVGVGGAQLNDLVCITGDLGAAYMGLQLLEREKRVLAGHENPQPEFEGREEILRRQLLPEARVDIIEALAENDLLPTSMVALNDGLAADMLSVCGASNYGVRLYLECIPISRATREMATELNADHVIAALNGGDDHELLFTLPLAMQEKIVKIGGIDVIGHITAASTGADLVLPDGQEIALSKLAIEAVNR